MRYSMAVWWDWRELFQKQDNLWIRKSASRNGLRKGVSRMFSRILIIKLLRLLFLVKQTMFLKLNMFFTDEYWVLCGNKSLLSWENPVRKKPRDIVIEGKLLQGFIHLFNFNFDSYETHPRDVVWHCHFGKY